MLSKLADAEVLCPFASKLQEDRGASETTGGQMLPISERVSANESEKSCTSRSKLISATNSSGKTRCPANTQRVATMLLARQKTWSLRAQTVSLSSQRKRRLLEDMVQMEEREGDSSSTMTAGSLHTSRDITCARYRFHFGDPLQSMYAHRAIICQVSEWFRQSLEGKVSSLSSRVV